MKTEYHLDLTDIQKIIAEKYGVSTDCVEICCYLEDVGYGLDEREEPSVEAIIKTN